MPRSSRNPEWSANELTVAAGIGIATVKRFEFGQTVKEASVALMRSAIEEAGVDFIMPEGQSMAGGVGVRLSAKRLPQHLGH